jgi:hypothetical protein
MTGAGRLHQGRCSRLRWERGLCTLAGACL